MFTPPAVIIGSLPSSTRAIAGTRSTAAAWRLPLTLTAILLTARAAFWSPESPAAPLIVPAPPAWSGLVAVEHIHTRPILGISADLPFTAQAWVERGDARILVSEGMRIFADDRLVTRGVLVDLLVPVCGEVTVPENTSVVPGRWSPLTHVHDLDLHEAPPPQCPRADEAGRAVAVSDVVPVDVAGPERMSTLQGDSLESGAR